MSNLLLRYPLDITGTNPDNFVNGEIHNLSTKLVRAVAPTYGAYFTESLKIYDNVTQRLLVRGVHYLCTELLQSPTEQYGKEICYLILIIDPTVSQEVIIQYQLLGGLYTRSGDAIANIYETITADERPVNWLDVLNRPIEFPPTQHLHDGRDIYGYEYLVTALERVRNAIVVSDVPAYQQLMNWLEIEIKSIRDFYSVNFDVTANHTVDVNNPHDTTKEQLMLGSVQNLTTATAADINNLMSLPLNADDRAIPVDKYVTLKTLLQFKNMILSSI